jgi:hypothetical protein
MLILPLLLPGIAAAAAGAVAAAAFYRILCRDVPHASLFIVLPFAAGRGSHPFGTDSYVGTCRHNVGNPHFNHKQVIRLNLF